MQILRKDTNDPALAENIGQNYRQLVIWLAIVGGIAALLATAYWYGYVIYPWNEVLWSQENVRPLREEISLGAMPVLPDELATEYDNLNADQRNRLETFEWVDEGAGVVSIPVDDAIDLLLEEGLPVRTEAGGE